MKHEEYAIQCALVKHLRAYGKPNTFWFHAYNKAANPKEGARAKALGARAGVPDLTLCRNGYYYGLELKIEKGKLSAAQVECLDLIDKAGGVVSAAYDLDQAVKQLVRWGFL